MTQLELYGAPHIELIGRPPPPPAPMPSMVRPIVTPPAPENDLPEEEDEG